MPLLNSFLDGNSACILNHGTTGSGKTFTMFECLENLCILSLSTKYLLEQSPDPLKITAVEIKDNKIFDVGSDGQTLLKWIDATQVLIHTLDEFSSFVKNILTHRTQKATDQNSTSSRSHLIVKIDRGLSASIAFVDLAGFESPKAKENHAETQFINSTLTELNNVLIKVSRQETPTCSSMLTKILKRYLTNSQTIMLYHVKKIALKKGLETIKDVVACNKAAKRRKSPVLQSIENNMKRIKP